MTILNFIILVVLIGVAMWAINAYVPMAPSVKSFLNVAVVIILVLLLLSLLGLMPVLNRPLR